MNPPSSTGIQPDTQLLRPGLRAVIAGTVGRGRRPSQYYAGVGNRFWELLQGSGLIEERLGPDDAERLPGLGIGLTDLVIERVRHPGREPEMIIHRDPFDRAIRAAAPAVLAFVSKTAASWYARGAGLRHPQGYGEVGWTVAGIPAFVLPGPSGANNGMPLALRTALWADLADYLEHLGSPSEGMRP